MKVSLLCARSVSLSVILLWSEVPCQVVQQNRELVVTTAEHLR